MRPAASTRASMSRPSLSVPNGCAHEGAASVLSSEIESEPGRITEESSESTTTTRKTASPT